MKTSLIANPHERPVAIWNGDPVEFVLWKPVFLTAAANAGYKEFYEEADPYPIREFPAEPENDRGLMLYQLQLQEVTAYNNQRSNMSMLAKTYLINSIAESTKRHIVSIASPYLAWHELMAKQETVNQMAAHEIRKRMNDNPMKDNESFFDWSEQFKKLAEAANMAEVEARTMITVSGLLKGELLTEYRNLMIKNFTFTEAVEELRRQELARGVDRRTKPQRKQDKTYHVKSCASDDEDTDLELHLNPFKKFKGQSSHAQASSHKFTGQSYAPASKQVTSAKLPPCENCTFAGIHITADCTHPLCLYCLSMYSGHSWHNCPDRLADKPSNNPVIKESMRTRAPITATVTREQHGGERGGRGRGRGGRGKVVAGRGRGGRGRNAKRVEVDDGYLSSSAQEEEEVAETQSKKRKVADVLPDEASFDELLCGVVQSRPPAATTTHSSSSSSTSSSAIAVPATKLNPRLRFLFMKTLKIDKDDDDTAEPRSLLAVRNAVSNCPKLLLDSGASRTIVPNEECLEVVSKRFNNNDAGPTFTTANNAKVQAIAKGDVSDLIQNAYVVESVQEPLLSVCQLQKQGLTVVFPAHTAKSKGVGAYAHDSEGHIVFVVARDLKLDPLQDMKFMRIPHHNVDLSNIPQLTISRVKINGANTNLNDLVYWMHLVLGHASMAKLCYAADHGAISNFPITSKQIRAHWTQCVACTMGHSHRKPLHRHIVTATPATTDSVSSVPYVEPTEPEPPSVMVEGVPALKICTDILGPITIPSHHGAKHVASYTDAYTGLFLIYPLKSKSDLVATTKSMFDFFEKHGKHSKAFGMPVSVLQADAEAVYLGQEMQHLLDEHRCTLQHSAPNTHEQAGVAERIHRTVGDKAATLFAASPWVPRSLWYHALTFAALTMNMLPKVCINTGKSPVEMITGLKPDLQKMCLLPFGQPCTVNIPKETRKGKLSPKGVPMAFVGHSAGTKDCGIFYNYATKRTVMSRDFVLLDKVPAAWGNYSTISVHMPENLQDLSPEERMALSEGVDPAHQAQAPQPAPALIPERSTQGQQAAPREPPIPAPADIPALIAVPTPTPTPAPTTVATSARAPVQVVIPTPPTTVAPTATTPDPIPEPSAPSTAASPAEETTRYFTRSKGKHASLTVNKVTDNTVTPTLKQAMQGPYHAEWTAACNKEDKQMVDQGVFQYVDKLPRGGKLIRTFYTLRQVMDANGKPVKFKARLVANGKAQPDDTYDMVSSPTAQRKSSSVIFAIAAAYKRRVSQFDVPGAYLQCKVSDTSTMKVPPNLYVKLPSNRIAKLLKYLYGLKQSGREWNDTLTKYMVSQGYTVCEHDPCIYIKRKGDHFHILDAHVDDILSCATDTDLEERFFANLCARFGECTRKSGDSFTYLGMLVEHKADGSIFLSQPGYIDKILKITGLDNCNPADNPSILETTDDEDRSGPADKKIFMRNLGLIGYLATNTRPDIANAYSRVAINCSAPTIKDMQAINRIIRYLAGTRSHGLHYKTDVPITLEAYVDASYNSHADARSHLGYTLSLGHSTATIHAKSGKIKCVVLSSTEAEYVALFECAKEIKWMRGLLEELGFPQMGPTVVYEDNTACIALANGHGNHKRTKHFNVRLHYVRELVNDDEITVQHVSSEDMLADLLTKSMPKVRFNSLARQLLGMDTCKQQITYPGR
jgi:hypothetical protein